MKQIPPGAKIFFEVFFFVLVVALGIVALVLSGCTNDISEEVGDGLMRYRDADAGVTCYRVRTREGLSCLRDGK